MTKEESIVLAESIEGCITGVGEENSSGYHVICREILNGTDYIGLVDVSFQCDEDTGEEQYNVYSIACEDGGEDICEAEWDTVHASISALAEFLLNLANVSFRRSEIERLVSA